MSIATLSIVNLDINTDPKEYTPALYSSSEVHFMVSLMLSETKYIPPFLPTFQIDITKTQIKILREKLNFINTTYKKCEKSEIDYDNEGKSTIYNSIQELGHFITTMSERANFNFRTILEKFHELKYDQRYMLTDIIIYTNDVSIPWQWLLDLKTSKFLCEEFSTGTIFSAEPTEATSVLYPRRHQSILTRKSRYRSRPKALLMGGNLDLTDIGDKISEDNEIINKHLREIYDLISNINVMDGGIESEAFNKEDIKVISKYFDNDSRNIDPASEFHQYMANPKTKVNLKLLHYVGHFGNNSLILDTDSLIENEEMRDYNLDNQPLIFLNACRTGIFENPENKGSGIMKKWSPGSFFSTELLNKKAVGVIVTLLPIHSSNHHFAIEFYRRLLHYEDNIGTALKKAREVMQNDDPEKLYFQLYGDPRGYIFNENEELDEH